MKTLIFFLITLISLAYVPSYAQKKATFRPKKLKTGTPIYSTLNKIEGHKFDALKDSFEKKVLNRFVPKKQISFYFRREIIDNIFDLLTGERKGLPENSKKIPDGIRIYFVKETDTSTNLSLALVSTKFNGIEKETGLRRHKDYYEHDNHHLFELDSLSGDFGQGNCDGGASLQDSCTAPNCYDDDCRLDDDHRVVRKYGEEIVRLSGKYPINTQGVWFSYKLLKNIVKSRLDFNGIRLYFSRYGPKGSKGPNGGKLESEDFDRDTFIIMTTRNITKVINGKPKTVHADQFRCDGMEKGDANMLFVAAFNKGELCPTHCN